MEAIILFIYLYIHPLAVSFIITTTICQEIEEHLYRILPFEASTGLYYEYLGTVRRTTSTWRVTNFLDAEKLQQGLGNYRKKLKTLPKLCQPVMENEC